MKERKGAKIEVIEHRSGLISEVRFEKSSGTFFAEVGPDYVEGKELNDVRNRVRSLLGKLGMIEWTPVVDVNTSSNRYGYRGKKDEIQADINIEVERYWLGQTPGGRIVKLEWQKGDEESSTCLKPEDRLNAAEDFNGMGQNTYAMRRGEPPKRVKLVLPYKDGKSNLLHYTPELWASLLDIVARIDLDSRTLDKLVNTKEGVKALTERGARALIPAKTGE